MTQASVGFAACPNHPDTATGLQPCVRCGGAYCADCLVPVAGRLHCATCKDEQLRDIAAGRGTSLPFAGPGRRLVAQIVDGVVIAIPFAFLAFFMFFAAQGASPTPPTIRGATSAGVVLMVMTFGGVVAYEALFLMRGGQTPGKMLLGLKVVRPDGGRISTGQAWGRALARAFFGLTRILGVVDAVMVFSSEGRTLHDRVGKTRVISLP